MLAGEAVEDSLEMAACAQHCHLGINRYRDFVGRTAGPARASADRIGLLSIDHDFGRCGVFRRDEESDGACEGGTRERYAKHEFSVTAQDAQDLPEMHIALGDLFAGGARNGGRWESASIDMKHLKKATAFVSLSLHHSAPFHSRLRACSGPS